MAGVAACAVHETEFIGARRLGIYELSQLHDHVIWLPLKVNSFLAVVCYLGPLAQLKRCVAVRQQMDLTEENSAMMVQVKIEIEFSTWNAAMSLRNTPVTPVCPCRLLLFFCSNTFFASGKKREK